MDKDDLLALLGALCVLAGVYLLAGVAAVLIAGGLTLIYVGWRYQPGGSDGTD